MFFSDSFNFSRPTPRGLLSLSCPLVFSPLSLYKLFSPILISPESQTSQKTWVRGGRLDPFVPRYRGAQGGGKYSLSGYCGKDGGGELGGY